MTRDIDVVVDPTEDTIKLMVDLVDRDRFSMGDAEDAFLNRSMFNLIEPDTGWKGDFVIRKDRPFSATEFQRRFPTHVAGVEVFMATAEDTMLAKLEWGAASGSDRQMDDVIAIASNQDVDVGYLSQWAAELGVIIELEAALASAGKSMQDAPHPKRWEQIAHELVLHRDDRSWRFAIANSSDTIDGRLPVDIDMLVDAQSELLARVEEMISTRYSAEWRLGKPGWWSATLTPM